jgi:hypothetical protein
MKTAAGLFVLVLLRGGVACAQDARFKGYLDVNQTLCRRLFEPGSKFELGQYLGEGYSDRAPNLLDLLGTYKGDDLASKFKNGTPNSANMLLWHFLLASFSRDVSRQCGPAKTMALRPSFSAAVQKACTWPAPAARSDETLENLWTLVMAYDAPQSEFLAWKEFVQTAAFDSREDAVFAMLLTITYNPHFLLRK